MSEANLWPEETAQYFGQGVAGIDRGPNPLDDCVGLGEIFAIRAFPLDEIGDGVEPQSVDAQVQPEITDLFERFVHCRIVEVQVGLVGVKAMPVISLCQRIPRPVRSLEIFEDDSGILVFFRRIAPYVEIPVSEVVVTVAGIVGPT